MITIPASHGMQNVLIAMHSAPYALISTKYTAILHATSVSAAGTMQGHCLAACWGACPMAGHVQDKSRGMNDSLPYQQPPPICCPLLLQLLVPRDAIHLLRPCSLLLVAGAVAAPARIACPGCEACR